MNEWGFFPSIYHCPSIFCIVNQFYRSRSFCCLLQAAAAATLSSFWLILVISHSCFSYGFYISYVFLLSFLSSREYNVSSFSHLIYFFPPLFTVHLTFFPHTMPRSFRRHCSCLKTRFSLLSPSFSSFRYSFLNDFFCRTVSPLWDRL